MQITVHTLTRSFQLAVVGGALVLAAGCIQKQSPPPLAGPSGFDFNMALTATPNVIPRDGVSTSQIGVTAFKGGAPLANQLLSLSATAGRLPVPEVVTNAQGVASFTLVAPGPTEDVNSVVVSVLPIGSTDYANVRASTTEVAVLGPPVPALPTAKFTVVPASPIGGQAVVFDGSTSTAGSGTSLVEYAWDFGNGDTATATLPLYRYSGYGAVAVDTPLVVTLTVKDGLGRTATTQKVVTVKP